MGSEMCIRDRNGTELVYINISSINTACQYSIIPQTFYTRSAAHPVTETSQSRVRRVLLAHDGLLLALFCLYNFTASLHNREYCICIETQQTSHLVAPNVAICIGSRRRCSLHAGKSHAALQDVHRADHACAETLLTSPSTQCGSCEVDVASNACMLFFRRVMPCFRRTVRS